MCNNFTFDIILFFVFNQMCYDNSILMNIMSIMTSFLICLFGFLVVGLLSSMKRKNSTEDYLLAGHSVKPWLAALSAVATNNSGYMFIGMIGFTYTAGLSSIWLMIGWVLGDFVVSFLVHPKLRDMTEKRRSLSFSEVLGKWQGTDYRRYRFLAGLITVLFLGTYAAAQFKAGSKALHVLFGWDFNVGAIIGAVMVLLYCFSGGIRASIWTDAAQSFVMIISMGLLCGILVKTFGGFVPFWETLDQVSPTYLNWFPTELPFGGWGAFLFVLGWFFAGIGVVGQPHIMVRFMALDSVKHMSKVRWYYYTWYILFYLLTIWVGFGARLVLSDSRVFDAELALPFVSIELLPAFLVGLVLAGLFSATMSTADSQILSCTASVTRDLIPEKFHSYYLTKSITVFITVLGLVIALFAPASVFNLVLIAWSGLASAFAPLMLLYVFKCKVSEGVAIAMTVTGLMVVTLWQVLGLNAFVYEIFPGIISGFVVYAGSLLAINSGRGSEPQNGA